MRRKVEGIVINAVDYKENSKIINILTKEEGIIGVIARGVKSIKSPLRTTTTVLSYGEFYLSSRSSGLSTLTEVDITDYFKEIRKDLLKMNYSLFLLELCSSVSKHDNDNNIYTMLISGLKKINEGYDASIITNIIEMKLLDNLGIRPNLDSCVVCGSKFDIVTISSYKGGYLCTNCVGKETIFHLKTLQLIRMFYYIDLSKITKIDISETIKKEISLFIDDYYERYSGLYLKSKTFLEEFTKVNI